MNRNQKIFQIVGSLVLLLWGGILIYFYHSGRIFDYLERFFPVTALVGGIILLILGLFNLLTIRQPVDDCGSCCGHEHDHEGDHEHAHHKHDHDHAHEHHSHSHEHDEEDNIYHHGEQDSIVGILVTACILVIPISYAAAYAPVGKHQFSLDSVDRKGAYEQNYGDLSESVPSALRDLTTGSKSTPATGSSDGSSGDPTVADTGGNGDGGDTSDGSNSGSETNYYDPYTIDDVRDRVGTTPEGALLLDVVEVFYTAGDREMQTILDGQLVELTAQAIPEKVNNPDGTRLRVMQLFVQCCLADARPFSIPIEFGKTPPDYREMGWHKVTGKITYRVEDGTKTPVIEVTRFEEAEEPDRGNMYY